MPHGTLRPPLIVSTKALSARLRRFASQASRHDLPLCRTSGAQEKAPPKVPDRIGAGPGPVHNQRQLRRSRAKLGGHDVSCPYKAKKSKGANTLEVVSPLCMNEKARFRQSGRARPF